MTMVYFMLPIFGGYHIMQWAISKSNENLNRHHDTIRERKEMYKAVTDIQNAQLQSVLTAARSQSDQGGGDSS
jgi:hypothetical protein